MMYKLSVLVAFVAMTTGAEACGGGAPKFTDEEAQNITGVSKMSLDNSGDAAALSTMPAESLTVSAPLQEGDTPGYPSQPPKTVYAKVNATFTGTGGIKLGPNDTIVGVAKSSTNEYLTSGDADGVLKALNDKGTEGIWVIKGKSAAPLVDPAASGADSKEEESESVAEEGGMGAGPIIGIVVVIIAIVAFFAMQQGGEGGNEDEEGEGEEEGEEA